MRSTNSAPLALSNSYFTGSPPTGTSMTTLRLSGGLSPAGIRSISMARALDRGMRIGEAGIALGAKLAQIDFDKVRERVGRQWRVRNARRPGYRIRLSGPQRIRRGFRPRGS